MLQNGKSYVFGTAAKKLEDDIDVYDVYKENKVLKNKKIERLNNKVKLKIVFCVAVVFVLCFGVIFRYAQITELNYNINKSNKSYNELKNENSRLRVDIEKSTDLQKIREMAETKLGMQKPDRFQVVYVNVPKSDFTKASSTDHEENTVGTSSFTAMLSKARKLTHWVY